MARDDERVRERLGALDGGRAAHGGRWDLEESVGRDDDRYDEGPRTPQWLSEPADGGSVWHERFVPQRLRGTRWDPGRRGLIVIAAVGLVAVVLAAAAAQRERPAMHAVPPLPTVGSVVASAGPLPSETVAAPSATPPGAKPVERTPVERPGELVVSVVGLV
ncbi:hypothetical protein NDR87_09510 [Nocardia sp. CDC159]|uniref:Uncharacterized protein n=1 Tax=Nocardia pulmonis TaxID=2951408 RepID=A0A9X2E4X6_9NOCA|nr:MULTISPECIES: hypothetical protein [Nocardia]MCM6773705.1 hypothetical protein [Nocardia pulmonis]MCM6786592.1 hypothetical protein [Nocardia sp. CDC159]